MNSILVWVLAHIYWTEVIYTVESVFGLYYAHRETQDCQTDLVRLRHWGLNGPRTTSAKGNLRLAVGCGMLHTIALLTGVFAMLLPRTPTTAGVVISMGLILIQFVPAWLIFMARVDRRALMVEVEEALKSRDPVIMALIDAYKNKVKADLLAEIATEGP